MDPQVAALSQLDGIIARVQALSGGASSAAAAAGGLGTQRTAFNPQVTDFAWAPLIPQGHTPFSWGLEPFPVQLNTAGAAMLLGNDAAPSLDTPTVRYAHSPAYIATETDAFNADASAAAALSGGASSSAAAAAESAQPAPAANTGKKGKQGSSKKGGAADAGAGASSGSRAPVPTLEKAVWLPFTQLELRVGQIESVELVPGKDHLYKEMIRVGDSEVRQIFSGLREWYADPNELMNGRVLVFTNLKPRNFGDESTGDSLVSYGMVLCAAKKKKKNKATELVRPAAGTPVGTRVSLESLKDAISSHPALPEIDASLPDNIFSGKENTEGGPLVKQLKTNATFEACFNGVPLWAGSGPCVVQNALLKNAPLG